MNISMSLEDFEKVFSLFTQRELFKEANKNIELIKKIVTSVTREMKIDLVESLVINIHVGDLKRASIEFKEEQIKKVSNPWMVYLLCKMMEDDKSLGKEIISIYLTKYSKKGYESGEYFGDLLTVFSHVDKGSHVQLSSLEKFLTKTDKLKYVKGARKSVTTTLTGVNEIKTFSVHPAAKDEIVLIENLKNHLDLTGKHRRTNCPVCDETHLIDETNITKILSVDGDIFKYVCLHEKNNVYIDKEVFKMSIRKYVNSKDSILHKSMFVLNNFKKLVEEGQGDEKEVNHDSA